MEIDGYNSEYHSHLFEIGRKNVWKEYGKDISNDDDVVFLSIYQNGLIRGVPLAPASPSFNFTNMGIFMVVGFLEKYVDGIFRKGRDVKRIKFIPKNEEIEIFYKDSQKFRILFNLKPEYLNIRVYSSEKTNFENSILHVLGNYVSDQINDFNSIVVDNSKVFNIFDSNNQSVEGNKIFLCRNDDLEKDTIKTCVIFQCAKQSEFWYIFLHILNGILIIIGFVIVLVSVVVHFMSKLTKYSTCTTGQKKSEETEEMKEISNQKPKDDKSVLSKTNFSGSKWSVEYWNKCFNYSTSFALFVFLLITSIVTGGLSVILSIVESVFINVDEETFLIITIIADFVVSLIYIFLLVLITVGRLLKIYNNRKTGKGKEIKEEEKDRSYYCKLCMDFAFVVIKFIFNVCFVVIMFQSIYQRVEFLFLAKKENVASSIASFLLLLIGAFVFGLNEIFELLNSKKGKKFLSLCFTENENKKKEEKKEECDSDGKKKVDDEEEKSEDGDSIISDEENGAKEENENTKDEDKEPKQREKEEKCLDQEENDENDSKEEIELEQDEDDTE